jgi:hypothetical protein
VGGGSLEPAASLACSHRARVGGRGLSGAQANRLGAALDRRRGRPGALDGPRDLASPRALTRSTQATSGLRALRVALSGRLAAHGRQALPALPASRPCRHRRSPQDLSRQGTAAGSRLLSRHRRRPLTAGLRRAAGRRARHHDDRVLRARPGLVRRPRHRLPARDDRRRLELHPQPIAARTLGRARHPPHRHTALHAALERQGLCLSLRLLSDRAARLPRPAV